MDPSYPAGTDGGFPVQPALGSGGGISRCVFMSTGRVRSAGRADVEVLVCRPGVLWLQTCYKVFPGFQFIRDHILFMFISFISTSVCPGL